MVWQGTSADDRLSGISPYIAQGYTKKNFKKVFRTSVSFLGSVLVLLGSLIFHIHDSFLPIVQIWQNDEEVMGIRTKLGHLVIRSRISMIILHDFLEAEIGELTLYNRISMVRKRDNQLFHRK